MKYSAVSLRFFFNLQLGLLTAAMLSAAGCGGGGDPQPDSSSSSAPVAAAPAMPGPTMQASSSGESSGGDSSGGGNSGGGNSASAADSHESYSQESSYANSGGYNSSGSSAGESSESYSNSSGYSNSGGYGGGNAEESGYANSGGYPGGNSGGGVQGSEEYGSSSGYGGMNPGAPALGMQGAPPTGTGMMMGAPPGMSAESNYPGGMAMGEAAAPGGMAPEMGGYGMAPGMGGYGGQAAAPPDPAPAEDADYLEKGKYAFAIGKEAAAQKYLIAHLLADDAAASKLMSEIRWAPGLKRPASTIRFGVGIDLKAPPNLSDVRPIGRSQFAQAGGGGGGGGDASGYGMPSGGMAPGGAPAAGGGQKTFQDLTGGFGEALVTAFEAAWENGDFGTIFNAVEPITPPSANRADGAMGGMAGMMSGMMGAGPGGEMGYGGGVPGGESGYGGAPAGAAAARPKTAPGKAIVPGLFYLGTGGQSDIVSKAEKEGIDYIFFFEVSVEARRNLISNDTRLRLVSAKGENLGASSTLNNLKVDRAAATGESADLNKAIASIFKRIESLRFTNLPALENRHAVSRVQSLVAKPAADPFPILLEIRLYNHLGLLTDDEKSAAYQIVLNNSGGELLASGSLEDRQEVLDPILPEYK
jgi:hypothetical protein